MANSPSFIRVRRLSESEKITHVCKEDDDRYWILIPGHSSGMTAEAKYECRECGRTMFRGGWGSSLWKEKAIEPDTTPLETLVKEETSIMQLAIQAIQKIFPAGRVAVNKKNELALNRAALNALVRDLCRRLQIVDPTRQGVLAAFNVTNTKDEAWKARVKNLRTAGDVLDALIELNVTSQEVLEMVLGRAVVMKIRPLSFKDALAHTLYRG